MRGADLGYNEMGFMNETRGLITPNLDALAHAGVVLRNYYVLPICSPTRSARRGGSNRELHEQSNTALVCTESCPHGSNRHSVARHRKSSAPHAPIVCDSASETDAKLHGPEVAWANFSLLWLYSHLNAWANLHILHGPT